MERTRTRRRWYDGAVEGPYLFFGTHRVRQDGELVELQLLGAAGYPETVAFHDMLARVTAEHGRCYLLVDISGLTGIEAKARRYVSEWNRRHRITAGSLYGVGFTARVFITLLLNTIRLMNADPPEVHTARDEAGARRWLAARRASDAS